MNTTGFFDSAGRNLRYALRGLRGAPTFTFAAVVTLALGIGATTAIFSVVYSVLIKPLPYPNGGDLVRIRHTAPGNNIDDLAANANMFLTYRDENRTLASIGLWQEGDATLTGSREPARVRALRVTEGTLQTLGVQPMRGRWFTEAEHGPVGEGPEAVILSHAFWQTQFGGDEAAIGADLSIDSRPSRVVGIMPPEFDFLDMPLQPDVIVAVRINPARTPHGIYQYQMLARLGPGVTVAAASADIERMLPIWIDAWPLIPGAPATAYDAIRNMRITPIVRPLKDDLVGGVSSMLWVLMGAVGAVLLIACANVANLTLVRADARRQDLAVRAALGAAPARIAIELLVESLVLGIVGSLVGLVFANAGLHLFIAIGPSDLPRLREITIYPPVLAFAMVVSLASTLAFGSITALKHALHIDKPMSVTARGSTASRERNATRSALVVVQVGLALVLVVSAALMIRTFQAMRDVDPGFSEPETIQTARIWIPTAVFPEAERYTRIQREILDKIVALPGVVSAGFASAVPMEAPGSDSGIAVEGQTVVGDAPPSRRYAFVSPGYFEALGTRLIAGRSFTWSDLEAGGRVAVISQNFAREIADDPAAALGRRVRLAPFGQDAWREVIGVVQDVHQDGLHEPAPSSVYWPVLAENMFARPVTGTPSVTFAIRSERAGTATLMEEVRQAVRSASASIPIGQERTMRDYYAGSLARTSFTLVMLTIAGTIALILGVIGIYGVIGYIVSQRTREMGIRSALGASPRHLERMFVLHGLALTGVGAFVGLVTAVALGHLMSSLLFGIGPTDAAAYGSALGVTLAAAALASYLPARRASRVDPIETLRVE
jgi:predicted permease